jgi:hypothetical protein
MFFLNIQTVDNFFFGNNLNLEKLLINAVFGLENSVLISILIGLCEFTTAVVSGF